MLREHSHLRRFGLSLLGDLCDLTVYRGHRRARFAQRQPFDERRKIGRELPLSFVGANRSHKTDEAVGAVALQPTPRRANGDTGMTRGASEWNVILKVWLKDGEPRHGLFALPFGQASKR